MRWPYNIFLWTLSLLVVIACSSDPKAPGARDEGHVVGNGGDLLGARLEAGRSHAIEVLNWLREARLERFESPLSYDATWLLAHRDEVRAEIEKMRLEVSEKNRPCPSHPGRWCACTLPTRGAPTWIAPSECDGTASITELGELMLHEALHHFLGSDEKRVYALAALAYRAWKGTLYRSPVGIEAPVYQFPFGSLAAWDGEAFFSWDPYREFSVQRYVPGQEWQSVTLRPRPPWLMYWERFRALVMVNPTAYAYAPSPRRLIVFFATGVFTAEEIGTKDPALGMAIEIDTMTGRWKRVSDAALPHDATFSTRLRWGMAPTVASDSKHLVIVKPRTEKEPAQTMIFDSESNRWKDITNAPPLHDGSAFQAVTLQGRYFYGAYPMAETGIGGWVTRSEIWRLDLQTHKWELLPKAGTPPLRYSPALQATNDGVMVYGGWTRALFVGDPAEVSTDGAWFSNTAGTWTEITTGPKPVGQSYLLATEGSRIHLVGRQWQQWSGRTTHWETLDPELGTLTRDYNFAAATPAGLIFWSTMKRTGMMFAR